MKAGPVGIMVVHPEGADPVSPRQMITELVTNMVQIFLAVILLGLYGAFELCGALAIHHHRRDSGRDQHQYFVLELVWLSWQLHSGVHLHHSDGICICRAW